MKKQEKTWLLTKRILAVIWIILLALLGLQSIFGILAGLSLFSTEVEYAFGYILGSSAVLYGSIYLIRKTLRIFKKQETKAEKKKREAERENQRIAHYKEHKKEIDKKENEDFKRMLKWIGGFILLLLIFAIVRSLT